MPLEASSATRIDRSAVRRGRSYGQPKHQRDVSLGRRAPGCAPALGDPGASADDRYQIRLRDGALWRLHRPPGWGGGALVSDPGVAGDWEADQIGRAHV